MKVGVAVLLLKGVKHFLRKTKPVGTCCEECDWGRAMNCPLWNGYTVDSWGEGLSSPDYCPKEFLGDEYDPQRDMVYKVLHHQRGLVQRTANFFRTHDKKSDREKFFKKEIGEHYYGMGMKPDPERQNYIHHLECRPKGIEIQFNVYGEQYESTFTWKEFTDMVSRMIDPYLKMGGAV